MLGGLHIEMAALSNIGGWLEDSGWTKANMASAGTSKSFLNGSHVSHTRHAHQVTSSSLYILMQRAYNKYIDNLEQNADVPTFENWKLDMISKSPQFQFWSITLELELTLLKCVQSLRQGDFQLYIDSLVRTGLHVSHPNVATEFQNGHFFVKKPLNAFSSLPIDHAHEQNNKSVKDDRGARGITENMSELLLWMVAGPEIARLIL